jgi:hypothetical protein
VSGRLNHVLVTALVVIAVAGVLTTPSAALASCGGGPSAKNVYTECVPAGGGAKPTGSATSGGNGTGAGSTSGPSTKGLPTKTAHALQHAGSDQRVLSSLLRGYGASQQFETDAPTDDARAPGALGSAFDLGSGPTALLILLGGTALALLGGSGVRFWRTRQRS